MFLNTFKKSWTKFKCSKAKNSKSSCGQYGVLEVSFIVASSLVEPGMSWKCRFLPPSVCFMLEGIKTFSQVPVHSIARFYFCLGLQWNWERVATETELALSAFWEVGGMRFTPTSECVTSASRLPWTERPQASHKGKPAGLGVAPGAPCTRRCKIWRNLLIVYFAFPSLPPSHWLCFIAVICFYERFS